MHQSRNVTLVDLLCANTNIKSAKWILLCNVHCTESHQPHMKSLCTMNECGHTGPVRPYNEWMNGHSSCVPWMYPQKTNYGLLTCLEPPNTSFFFNVGIVEDEVEICSLEQNYQIEDKLQYINLKINTYVVLEWYSVCRWSLGVRAFVTASIWSRGCLVVGTSGISNFFLSSFCKNRCINPRLPTDSDHKTS